MIGGSGPVGVDRQGLLGSLCAAGEEHDVVVPEAGQPRQTADVLMLAVATDTVELHRSGRDDVRGAEGPEALRIGRRAGADERHPRQHPADKRGDAAVATGTVLAQTPVGHDDRQPTLPCPGEKMGPELELTEDNIVDIEESVKKILEHDEAEKEKEKATA